MSKTLSIFRIVSLVEGTSLVALIFIAMPLKYHFGVIDIVSIVGWAHGILFLVYLLALLATSHIMKWSVGFFLLSFAASVVPTGTYLLDFKLRKMVSIQTTQVSIESDPFVWGIAIS